MQRLLITGSSGFLGSRIVEFYKARYEIFAPTHNELDITDDEDVLLKFEQYKPDFVIHCAAISDVGTCEREPEQSWKINVDGSKNIAKASARIQAKCLMCSSDQVYFQEAASDFRGTAGNVNLKGHTEDEKLVPANVYGREKLKAEEECLRLNPNCVMLRLSWMYDIHTLRQTERNDFIRILLQKLQGNEPLSYPVYDMRGITDVNEVVQNMEKAFQLKGGVYNFGAPNDQSTYETALKLFENLGWDVSRLQKNEEAFAVSPRNLCMSQRKINDSGICFSSTLEGLIRNLTQVCSCCILHLIN